MLKKLMTPTKKKKKDEEEGETADPDGAEAEKQGLVEMGDTKKKDPNEEKGDEPEEDGPEEGAEEQTLLEPDGSPRAPKNKPNRRITRFGQDPDEPDEEKGEEKGDEDGPGGGGVDGDDAGSANSSGDNGRPRSTRERLAVPRMKLPAPGENANGGYLPAETPRYERNLCTASHMVSLGSFILLVVALGSVSVVCVLDGQCFDYRRRDPAVMDWARTWVPVLLFVVLLGAVPMGFYTADRMDLVSRARKRLAKHSAALSVQQRSFLDAKVKTATTVVWVNFLLSTGLFVCIMTFTILAYQDVDGIRKDATKRWDSYGDRTVTYYTRDGQLSDKKGKDRLGDAAEAYASHVLTAAIATITSLVLPAISSLSFACKHHVRAAADRKQGDI